MASGHWLNVENGEGRLVSRNGNTFASFRDPAADVAASFRGADAVLDGEIVCLDVHGCPQFEDLMFRRGELFFVAFDALWINGEDLRSLVRIPGQAIHGFQSKSSSDSGRKHPAIPTGSHPVFGSCRNPWRARRNLLIGAIATLDIRLVPFTLFSNEKEGKRCRQKDCPCGRSKKFYDSSSGSGLPTGRLPAVARSTTVRSPITCTGPKRQGCVNGPCQTAWTKRVWKSGCFPPWRRGLASRGWLRVGPPSMKISTGTSMSPCNWFGRSTSSPIPMVTSTAGSVGCISSGPTSWTWSCGRSTVPEKSCSSIMRETRSRSSTPRPGRSRKHKRPFRKLEGNRAERFAKIDRPALRPLPAESYQFAEWKKARVNIDYHIEIERHYYSVPYALLHRELDARCTAMTVEIFHRGQRIASHARSSKIGGHTTIDAHRPKSHQRYLEWTPERLVRWASKA